MSELIVPGKWKCDRCGFEIVKTNLYVKTGTTGPDYSTQAEPCPNDGQLMRPMTWKEEAKLGDELIARLWQWHEDAMQLLGMAAHAMKTASESLARRDVVTAPAINALATAEHDIRQAIEAAKTIPGSPIRDLVAALRAIVEHPIKCVTDSDNNRHESQTWYGIKAEHIERGRTLVAKYPEPPA